MKPNGSPLPLQHEPLHVIPHGRSVATIIWGSIVLGFVIRIVVVIMPPTSAMLWDHHEYVQWGVKMLNDGLVSVHTAPPPQTPMWSPTTRTVRNPVRDDMASCNYPPLSMYVLYVQAHVLHGLDPTMASNTVTARVVYSLPAIVCDFLIAAGCYAMVRLRARRVAAAVAFAVAALAPPFIIDSAHWGQTDAWVLAPLVWMVWALMKRRWLVAGVLWGVALSVKPQAILLMPVWLAVLVMRPRWSILMGILAGPVILFVLGLPFTFGAGWDWLQRSYLDNLLHSYPDTTLKAFNIWYIDLLLCENDDATRTILGITKDLWGKLLFGGSLLAFLVLTLRRRINMGYALLVFTAAVCLLSVIVPTRVHERYILMPLPFLIACAGINRRLWWLVAPFLLAATFQISSLDWMRMGAYGWRYVEEKIHEEYDQMCENLPPDELAQYPPPEEMLASIRPQFLEDRWKTGDPIKEWSLTLLELTSAAGCLFMFVRELRSQATTSIIQSQNRRHVVGEE